MSIQKTANYHLSIMWLKRKGISRKYDERVRKKKIFCWRGDLRQNPYHERYCYQRFSSPAAY